MKRFDKCLELARNHCAGGKGRLYHARLFHEPVRCPSLLIEV